eukprot:403351303
MSKPIVCEYFIQNDDNEIDPKQNPYPNIFILPKKYQSIADVRIQDVLEAFPLAYADPHNYYVLRFETVLQISQTKRLTVWQDVDPSLDIAVPHNKEKIRIKALRLPRGIHQKQPKQQRQFVKAENYSKSQRTSAVGLEKPGQNADFDPVAQDYSSQSNKAKDSRMSFPDLGAVFSKFGGYFEDKSNRKSNANQNNGTSSLDPNIFEYEAKPTSHQQQYDKQSQDSTKNNFQNQNAQQNLKQSTGSIFQDDNQYEDEKVETEPNAWDNVNYQKVDDDGAGQSTNLLFTDTDDYQEDLIKNQQNQFQQNNSSNSGTFDIFNSDPNPTTNQQQTYQPPTSQFGNDLFDLNFNSDPVPTTNNSQQTNSSMPDGLNFNQPQVSQTKVEQVRNIFNEEQKRQNEWHSAQEKHDIRLNMWVGNGPMKNHIRVLLCTLQDVLWQGHTWQRVGMDKLLDPEQVKTCHKKAIFLCHPDKLRNCSDNPDKVYIGNRCFAAITEAYKQFCKEENIK